MGDQPVLLGDSIFRRLLDRNPGLFDPLSYTFCISGQRSSDLLTLLVTHRAQLKGRRVIVLIGANDLSRGQSCEALHSCLLKIVRRLRRLKCVVELSEVLPIPRLGREVSSAPSVVKINEYIRTFAPSGLRIIKVFDLFCSSGVVQLHLYEQFIGRSRRRDLVHPNEDGLLILLLALEG